MSYEMRIGLLAAIIIGVTVWGYKFMKGKNILLPSNTYFVTYTDVNDLAATSPVFIRGLKVGTVEQIELSEDLSKVTAKLDIRRGIKLAKGTEALVVSTSFMGGRGVVLDVPGPCEGDMCHQPGDVLPGRVQGLFESLLGGSDFDEYWDKVKDGVGEMFGTMTDSLNEESATRLAIMFRDLQLILSHVEGLTGQIDQNMVVYDARLKQSLANVEEFTGMLADNNENISSTLSNLNTLSEDLKNADLGNKAAGVVESADDAVAALEGTLSKADETLNQLNTLITDINEGKGSLGKLANDQELYENLNNSARNLDLLLQDFRLNPKRYVNVSVFGKKQKEYAVPEDDPANQKN